MKKTHILLIFFVLLFHAAGNYIFLQKSSFDFTGNSAFFLRSTIKNRNMLQEGSFKIQEAAGGHYPPLVMIVAALSSLVFGISQNTVIMTNLLYFAILLFSTYATAKLLYNSKIALFAVFLVSLFPGVFGYSRVYMLDFPLAAFVVFSTYIFLKINESDSLVYPIMGIISVAAGLLIRWTYILFLLPIIALRPLYKKKQEIFKTTICILAGVAIASIWYIPRKNLIMEQLTIARNLPSHLVMASGSRANYFNFFVEELLLWPFFVITVLSMVFLIAKKDYYLPLIVILFVSFFFLFRTTGSRGLSFRFYLLLQ